MRLRLVHWSRRPRRPEARSLRVNTATTRWLVGVLAGFGVLAAGPVTAHAAGVRSPADDLCIHSTRQTWSRFHVGGLTVDGRTVTTRGQQIPLGTPGSPCASSGAGSRGPGGGSAPEGGAPSTTPPSKGGVLRPSGHLPFHSILPHFPPPGRLSVTNAASRHRVRGGQVFDYRVTVRSVGWFPARRVGACDRLPRGLTFASVPPHVVFLNGTACWNVGTIRRHHRWHVTVRVRALASSSRHTAINRVQVVAGNAPAHVARAHPVTILPAPAPRS